MTALWRRFWELSPRERREFLEAFLRLPLAAVSVRLFGIGRWQRNAVISERAHDLGANGAMKLPEALSCARMVRAASRRGFVRGNCLLQSLALWQMLRRRGIASELRIGARKIGDALEAHAWVELGGHALNDSEEVVQGFRSFDGVFARAVSGQR
jgi:Transglutaminase-like superfamily